MRESDPCFDGERLYRGLIQEWVEQYHKTGRLSSTAVTLLGTSFDRSKYQAEPQPTLQRKAEFADVGQSTPEKVEGIRVEIQDAQKRQRCFQWRMIDEPLGPDDDDGPNGAHCQAWVVEEDQPPREDLHLTDGPSKRLRRKLAEQITPLGLTPPTPGP